MSFKLQKFNPRFVNSYRLARMFCCNAEDTLYHQTFTDLYLRNKQMSTILAHSTRYYWFLSTSFLFILFFFYNIIIFLFITVCSHAPRSQMLTNYSNTFFRLNYCCRRFKTNRYLLLSYKNLIKCVLALQMYHTSIAKFNLLNHLW